MWLDDNSNKILMKNIAVYAATQGYNIAMEHVFNSREVDEEKIRHYLKSDNHFIGLDSEVIDFIVETLKILDK